MKRFLFLLILGAIITLHLSVSLSVILFAFFIFSFFVFFTTMYSTFVYKNTLNKKSIFYLVFVSLLFVTTIIRGNIYGTYEYYIVPVIWTLFYPFSLIQELSRKYQKYIVFVIFITVAIEVFLGLGQSLRLFDNRNDYFLVGGSFGNSGAYAGFLGVTSPLVLSLLISYRRLKKYENLYYSLLALFIFILYLLIFSMSRGAWMACFVGCSIVIIRKFNVQVVIKKYFESRRKQIYGYVIFTLLLIIGGVFLYKLKEDSAVGRILVWKISYNAPHNNLLCGNGTGYVEAEYGKWQAAYFQEKIRSEKEQYVADYVTVLYNEFFEFILEYGIVLFALLLLVVMLAIFYCANYESSIELGAKGSIVAVLCLMLVSYPFKNFPVLLFFVLCISIIFSKKHKKNFEIKNKLNKFGPSLIGLLAISFCFLGMKNAYGYYLMNRAKKMIFENKIAEGLSMYESISGKFHNNGIFHFHYGSALFLSGDYQNASKELELSVRKCSNPNSYILLGRSYDQMKEYAKAKEAYSVAINEQPSRLYPKYLLVKSLIKADKKEEARSWAEYIVNSREKVPTTAGKEIKEEMLLFLNEQKK